MRLPQPWQRASLQPWPGSPVDTGGGRPARRPAGGTALVDTRQHQPRIDTPRPRAGEAREIGADPHPAELAREDVKQELAQLREQVELELRERRAETVRLEERVLQREESLEARLEDISRRERSLVDRERNAELPERRAPRSQARPRCASWSGSPASRRPRQSRSSCGRSRARPATSRRKLMRQIEEETRRDADRRVRSILSVTMQRLAAGHAAETTVSVVNLPSDDMKGRIIGREGRNIRVLENLTGVDFIIDDTPSAVVLSAFDGVRREIAKLTLDKLLQDGRIHPARIEEAYYQAKSEIEQPHHRAGRAGAVRGERPRGAPRAGQAARPAPVPDQLRPERARPLDRGLAPGGDDGRGARRERQDGAAGRAAARHRQGRQPRGRGAARARGRHSSRAATRRPRRSPTRWRRTTTRSRCRRSRR